MRRNNKFYVSKLNELTSIFAGYSWESGQWTQISNKKISSTPAIDVRGYSRIKVDIKYTKAIKTILYFLDENKQIISSKQLQSTVFDEDVEAALYVAVEVEFSVEYSGFDDYEYTCLKEINPHYKNIKKQYKKDNGQVFFRESLEGKINLLGTDYLFIRGASLEDTLAFYVYKNGIQYAANQFNKIDCKFDHFRCSVELKLTPKDKYTSLLNSYKKTYDLIKLAVNKTPIQLTKRSVIQIYIEGSDTITNYAGGTYWEDEVLESIDNQDALSQKYYFSKGPLFTEVSLTGFNYEINAAFGCEEGKNIWNSTSIKIVNNQKYKFPCSIVFTKVGSAGEYIPDITSGENPLVLRMSDSKTRGYRQEGNSEDGYEYYYLWDTYRIEIYTDKNGTGTKVYQSEYLFGNDSNFVLTNGTGLYKMVKVAQDIPNKEPEPASFFLGENVIKHQLWGRLLCDTETSIDGLTELYDLPYDDFATERANYKKCIGLQFSENGEKIIHFVSTSNSQEEPTQYGLTEYGEYFSTPFISGSYGQSLYAYPLARSTWGNMSLWIAFEEDKEMSNFYGVEHWSKNFYKTIEQKDCMEIGAVIKALLNKIDSSIKFESTSEHSEFLYGDVPNSYGEKNLKIFITQKSNVLKGEYDQAAQKAEITFEQLMNMMRDCFRCFWFIDSENRFRIEHLRYFTNGRNYNQAVKQYDLTSKKDRFNKKPTLYDQRDVSYSKSELKSRYEFAWADDSTESMGGSFVVDIKSNYVAQDEIENINIEQFSSDIDFMMFMPNEFSSDGFALIIAYNGTVPIIYDEIYDQRNLLAPMRLHTQNYYASFIKLFDNYLYDMPASNISASIDRDGSRYTVQSIKRSLEHTIKFQPDSDPDLYKLIGTDLGDGFINDVSVDIDTGIADITLIYEPR